MVKQKQPVKTSSRKGRSDYQFPCDVSSATPLPATIETKIEPDSAGAPGYTISGTVGEGAIESGWQEPPHVAFANLRVDEPQSVERYLREYGVLCASFQTDERQTRYEVPDWELKLVQAVLRDAWKGDSEAIVSLESKVEENIKADVIPTWGFVELRIKDLETLIAFLFLMDSKAGKLGICENPDCPAPYFKKKRSTQKFCEAGCVAYANRRYALKWWDSVGKKRRKQQQAKRQIKKRNTR